MGGDGAIRITAKDVVPIGVGGGSGTSDEGAITPIEAYGHACNARFTGVLNPIAIVVAPDPVANFDGCRLTEELYITQTTSFPEARIRWIHLRSTIS